MVSMVNAYPRGKGLDKAYDVCKDTPMDVLYTTLASQLELPSEHDSTPCQIVYQNDYIEVDFILAEKDVVWVRGYSHISGDRVDYMIHADTTLEVWAV